MKIKEKSKLKDLWRKLNFKYRLSATNENTLEEIWRFRTSIFWGALMFFVFGSMITVITAALIITTPIRNYLPGYLDTEIRDKALQTAIQMDALEQQLAYQEVYINNLRGIFAGANELDSVKIISVDTATIKDSDPRLLKSDRERSYVQNYESDEMYNLSVLINEVDLPLSGTAFYKPVKGLVIENFDLPKAIYGVKISIDKKETIGAALDGTVIYAGFSAADGYTIQIQHSNGFVSVYKHNTLLLCSMGDRVKSGQAIAVADSEKDGKEEDQLTFVIFELWFKGKPIDPKKYIYF